VRDNLQQELHRVRDDMSQRMQLMIELAGQVLMIYWWPVKPI